MCAIRNTARRRSLTVIAASLATALSLNLPGGSALAQDKPHKVVLRLASDVSPPPHPAGLAMREFAERLPQVIPGSEARVYSAGGYIACRAKPLQ